jgi:steroid delta-isomerase
MSRQSDRLTQAQMVSHAHQWVDAWNRRDLDAVLEHYAEDASFRSPLAAVVTGSSLLQGRSAMRSYWRAGLERLRSLHFELIDVICDPERQMMVVHYLATLDGAPQRACEIFHFRQGLKVYGEALYGGDVGGALRDETPAGGKE